MVHKQGLRPCFNHNMVEGDSWEALGNEDYDEDPTGIYRKTQYYCMNPDCDYHRIESYLVRYIRTKPPPRKNNTKRLENRTQGQKTSQKANKSLEKMKRKHGNN